MASPKELAALHNQPPGKMDAAFLRLMIRHHEGALPMAHAEIRRGKCPYVRDFARSVILSQQEEIWEMQGLLREKGLPPVRGGPSMHMGGMGGG